MIRLLYAGRLGTVCLLMGVLAFGEVGIQAGHPQKIMCKIARPSAKEQTEEAASEQAGSIASEQMEQKMAQLDEQEQACREKLQEAEAAIRMEEAEHADVMELREELRRIQVEKLVLKSRLEEKDTGNF